MLKKQRCLCLIDTCQPTCVRLSCQTCHVSIRRGHRKITISRLPDLCFRKCGARPAAHAVARNFQERHQTNLLHNIFGCADTSFAATKRRAKPKSQISLWSACLMCSLATFQIRLQFSLQSVQFHCSSADSLNHVSFGFQFKSDTENLFPFLFGSALSTRPFVHQILVRRVNCVTVHSDI